MSDVAISALASATTPADADYLVIVQSGVTKKILASDFFGRPRSIGATTPGPIAGTSGTFTGGVTSTSNAVNPFSANTTATGIWGHLALQRSAVIKGYVGLDASDRPALLDSAGAVRLFWDTSGFNGALGQTTPAALAATTGSFSDLLTVNKGSIAADTVLQRLRWSDSGGTRIGYLEFFSDSGADWRGRIGASNAGALYLNTNGGGGVHVNDSLSVTGAVTPSADNTYSCGTGSFRWSVIYAGTGTINTSDAREKTAVSPMTAAEVEASKQLAREIGTYKWLSAIAEKGDEARKHVGFTVQRAIEIMQANGLDPMAYGFICYDQWDDVFVEHPAIEAVDHQDAVPPTYEIVRTREGRELQVITDPGRPEVEAIEARDAWTEHKQVAGDRYAFRYDELNLFIARGFEARLAALEASA